MIMPQKTTIGSQQKKKNLKNEDLAKSHIVNSRMYYVANSRRTVSCRKLQKNCIMKFVQNDIVNSRELCSKVLQL